MKLHLHFPRFLSSIFGVLAIEENQVILSISGQESNFSQRDNNDEERPGLNIHPHTNILPTVPVYHQPGEDEAAAGLKVVLFDNEPHTIVPNKFRTSQVNNYWQSGESSCAVTISGYDHSGSESSDEEILANDCSDSDNNYTCIESISRFLLVLVYENLILSIFLRAWYLCLHLVLWSKRILSRRGSDACRHVSFMEGLEAGRFCASQRNVITNYCTTDSGSSVHGGGIAAQPLQVNIGQNTSSDGNQTIGGVSYEEGYLRLQVIGPRDVFINGQIHLNELSHQA